MRPLIRLILLLLISTACTLPGPGLAAEATGEGKTVVTPNMRAQLVSAFAAVQPGQQFLVAMRQQIRPGWHTYWQNPGDSGEPTDLAWQLPEGWRASGILWPAPSRIPVEPLVNFGYSNEVLLLTELTVPESAQPGSRVQLSADAFWLVCEEICIPEEGKLLLDLRVDDEPAASAWNTVLQQARSQLPKPAPWPVSARLRESQLVLQWPTKADSETATANYFPRRQAVIRHAAPQTLKRHANYLELTVPTDHAAAMDMLNGVLVITTDGTNPTATAFDITPTAPSAATTSPGWWLAIAMAFAGGVILNLMPCVFPVLSIKALSLVSLAQNHPGEQRRVAITHGLTYTVGVLLGFAVLAAVLLGLRNAGVAAGWGFHLQSAWVVLLLSWLFFLVGLNLSGVFEIGGGWMGIGQQLTEGHGHRQSLFTGLLAAVVATPCTAPFMGAAMGYALLQPAATGLAVFLFIGLGMAAPLLLLCAFPRWLNYLPRPGAWMVTFRELLAFPMYLSALWLLWVLLQQVGDTGLLFGLGGGIAIVFYLWLAKLRAGWLRFGARGVTVAALIGMFALLQTGMLSTAPGASAGLSEESEWQRYTSDSLKEARRAGPVFVNFTADWCITCKANELVALNTEEVRALFAQKQVTRLKADWTRRDATIARTLESFGRSGVPLYLWYADPRQSEPEILPQLLTQSMLLERLRAVPTTRLAGNR